MDAEHPIPQEVSTYQFKLVGDMTIQQFMQVAGGALVSLVIYSTNLAGYVKWPLILVSFLIGVAFAFFPIEDRPLTKWLVLFMKAIYSPTVYVWNKNAVRHEFFAPENSTLGTGLQQTTPLPAQQTTNAPTAAPTPKTELDELEAKEKEFLNKVNETFTKEAKQEPIIKPVAVTAQDIKPPQTTNIKKDIAVPEHQSVKVEPQQYTTQPKAPSGDIFSSQSTIGNQVSPIASHTVSNAPAATFSPEAAPPTPPTRPNVIVGQTLDTTGKIVDSAILEIKDSEGRSVRALRTNRLGHFMIVTPLTDGSYQISTEKEGYSFEPVSIRLENRVIPPIVIKGTKLSVNTVN